MPGKFLVVLRTLLQKSVTPLGGLFGSVREARGLTGKELLADHAVIPLYFYVSKHLVKPEVEGWQDNTLNYHYSQHLSFGAAERDGRP